MCGSTQDQQNLTAEQTQFYQQMAQQYSTVFGEDQAITGALTSAFTPILQAGPGQQGFSAAENTALNTQNTETVATDYAQAQKATAQILAAKGGGNTFLPSSTTANILAGNANAAAATRAQGSNAITQQNYAQGYQNWQTAASVLGSTAGLLDPTGFAGATTTAGKEATTAANDVATSNFAPWGAALGALGSVGGMAAGGYFQGLGKATGCWVASEIFGGWFEPRTVMVREWLWTDFNEGWIGHKICNLYLKYGERMAAQIRKHSALRMVFTPVFNLALRQAKRRQKWQTKQATS